MKQVYIILLIFISINCNSQIAQGDRILAWQVDMAENVKYDSAFNYAKSGCMESVHVFYTWSGIEPSIGSFDSSFISNTLDIANIYFPAFNTKVELQIAPINTNVKETPTELASTNFSDQTMIDRFKVLLDTLFKHIPNVELTALNIGNESDVYMGDNASLYTDYKTFLDSVIPYAKELYFKLHGKELKVGTTFTFDGLTSATKSTFCQSVNNNLDIVSLTYYPLNSDFTMKDPTVVESDFENLVNIYSNTSQPIYFAECGYSSSTICNSSEMQQADFYKNIFAAWDKYIDNIKYLTIFKTTDWSQQEVEDLGDYYGLSDIKFLEYLRTLGVRTWDNNGSNKAAYEMILCELNARNWCSTSCNLSFIKTQQLNTISLEPNPTYGAISLKTEQDIKNVWIYDVQGKLFYSNRSKTVNTQRLRAGVYSMVIEMESGKVVRKKFIKL